MAKQEAKKYVNIGDSTRLNKNDRVALKAIMRERAEIAVRVKDLKDALSKEDKVAKEIGVNIQTIYDRAGIVDGLHMPGCGNFVCMDFETEKLVKADALKVIMLEKGVSPAKVVAIIKKATVTNQIKYIRFHPEKEED